MSRAEAHPSEDALRYARDAIVGAIVDLSKAETKCGRQVDYARIARLRERLGDEALKLKNAISRRERARGG